MQAPPKVPNDRVLKGYTMRPSLHTGTAQPPPPPAWFAGDARIPPPPEWLRPKRSTPPPIPVQSRPPNLPTQRPELPQCRRFAFGVWFGFAALALALTLVIWDSGTKRHVEVETLASSVADREHAGKPVIAEPPDKAAVAQPEATRSSVKAPLPAPKRVPVTATPVKSHASVVPVSAGRHVVAVAAVPDKARGRGGVSEKPAGLPSQPTDVSSPVPTGGAKTCSDAPTLGTGIHWIADPKKAAKLAKDQGKLVFLIQVSGNFAKEEFT